MKKSFKILLIASLLLTCGCTGTTDFYAWLAAVTLGDEARDLYDNYKNSKDNETENEQEASQDGVYVTFANNPHLDITYYSDEGKTVELDSEGCWTEPGDTIYASIEINTNVESDHFGFDGFKVYAFDSSYTVIENPVAEISDENLAFTIPEDIEYTQLSVVPLGQFKDRIINTKVYSYDEFGNEVTFDSMVDWYVNGELYTEESTINPIDTYTVRCDFSEISNEYFYAGSNVETFTSDPESQTYVEFKTQSSLGGASNFEVELKEKMTLEIEFTENPEVEEIDGVDIEVKKKTVTITGLRYGDKVEIKSTGDFQITDGDYENVNYKMEGTGNTQTHIFTIVPKEEKDDSLSLENVNVEYEITLSSDCDYGTCTFKLDDEIVTGTIKARESQTLKLTYEIENEDYTFSDKNIVDHVKNIFVNEKQTVELTINSDLASSTVKGDDYFSINVKPGVQEYTVTLDPDCEHGTCSFKYDGDTYDEKTTITVIDDSEIKITYKITDDNYTFADSNFIENIFGNSKESIKITMTEEYDGKTIKAEDLFEVVKKE